MHFAKQIAWEKTETKMHPNRHNMITRRRTITSKILNQNKEHNSALNILSFFVSEIDMTWRWTNKIETCCYLRCSDCRVDWRDHGTCKWNSGTAKWGIHSTILSVSYLEHDGKHKVSFTSLLYCFGSSRTRRIIGGGKKINAFILCDPVFDSGMRWCVFT